MSLIPSRSVLANEPRPQTIRAQSHLHCVCICRRLIHDRTGLSGMGIHRVHQDPSECWCAKAKQPALTARPTCCIAIHWLLCPSLPMFLEAQRAIGLRTAHTICAHLPLLICLVRSSPHARSTSARSIAAARFHRWSHSTVGRSIAALSSVAPTSLARYAAASDTTADDAALTAAAIVAAAHSAAARSLHIVISLHVNRSLHRGLVATAAHFTLARTVPHALPHALASTNRRSEVVRSVQ